MISSKRRLGLLRQSWSSRLSFKYKILVDESIGNSAAEAIGSASKAVHAEYVREMPIKGAIDKVVVATATKAERIVVTTDQGMNEKRHPICTHSGIIIIASSNEFQHALSLRRGSHY